jgi:hypothetical protein
MTVRKSKIFIFGLFAALIIAFSFHVYLHSAYGYPLFGSFIIGSYTFNFVFVLVEVFLLSRLQKKEGSNIGSMYLGLSMVKFLVFFALFLPLYKMDGVKDRFEYFGFFVPYLICLFAGTVFLIAMLKKAD